MKKVSGATLSDLREALDYCPITGEFTWKSRRGAYPAGSKAGAVRPSGYIVICYKYERHFAHRLAWAFTHGEWPAEFIDHINRVPGDNRIENLRPANQSENSCNSEYSRSKHGLRHVTPIKGGRRWLVQVKGGGKMHYKTLDCPAAAYLYGLVLSSKVQGKFAPPPVKAA